MFCFVLWGLAGVRALCGNFCVCRRSCKKLRWRQATYPRLPLTYVVRGDQGHKPAFPRSPHKPVSKGAGYPLRSSSTFVAKTFSFFCRYPSTAFQLALSQLVQLSFFRALPAFAAQNNIYIEKSMQISHLYLPLPAFFPALGQPPFSLFQARKMNGRMRLRSV